MLLEVHKVLIQYRHFESSFLFGHFLTHFFPFIIIKYQIAIRCDQPGNP